MMFDFITLHYQITTLKINIKQAKRKSAKCNILHQLSDTEETKGYTYSELNYGKLMEATW